MESFKQCSQKRSSNGDVSHWCFIQGMYTESYRLTAQKQLYGLSQGFLQCNLITVVVWSNSSKNICVISYVWWWCAFMLLVFVMTCSHHIPMVSYGELFTTLFNSNTSKLGEAFIIYHKSVKKVSTHLGTVPT